MILEDVMSVHNGYAVKYDGTLWGCDAWCYLPDVGDSDVPVKIMDGVKSVASTRLHTLFIKNDNSLWGFGYNELGGLGIGEKTTHGYEPYECIKPIKIINNVEDVEVGYEHSLVLKTDGSVWGFGSNEYGQIGMGYDIKDTNKPFKMLENIKEIYTGESASFAISEDNILWECGTHYGLGVGLKDSEMNMFPVQYLRDVKGISSHWGFNIILKTDGTLWIYGDTENSTTGYTTGGRFPDLHTQIADNVNSLSEWNDGEYHKTLVLKNNGELYEFDLLRKGDSSSPGYKMTKVMDNVKLPDNRKSKEKKHFVDISDKSPEMQQAVNALSKAEIIEGTSETEFSPDKPITRAEIAALLLRMTAKNDEDGNGGFTDVTDKDWYYTTAGASKKYGIISGFDDNTFRGDEPVSKVQIVSLAARVLRNESNHINEEADTKIYSNIPDWAMEDVLLAVYEGLISAEEVSTLTDNPMNRGEAAVILYMLYDKI